MGVGNDGTRVRARRRFLQSDRDDFPQRLLRDQRQRGADREVRAQTHHENG